MKRVVLACLAASAFAGCGPPEIETGFVPIGNHDGLWGVTFGADWKTQVFEVGDLNGLTAESAYYHWRPGRNVLACAAGVRLGWMVTDKPKELRTRDSSEWRFCRRPALGSWVWPRGPENRGTHVAFTLGHDARLRGVDVVGIG